jgi:hypothetical protein
LIEDLSKLKTKEEPQTEIFDVTAQPMLWAYRENEEAEPYAYAFGYPCGEYLCLVPLKEEVEVERTTLWAAPVCKSEEDAKRMFFLVGQLLNSLDAFTAE